MTYCTIVAKPHPFQTDRVKSEVQQGQTIAEMLGDTASHSIEVTMNGVVVAREWWGRVRPKAGQILHVSAFPQGGDGDKWLRAVLMVVVMVVAWYAAPYLTGAWGPLAGANTALVASGIYMIGSLHGRPLLPEVAA